MRAFLRFPGFKKKALTLSYDDATVHDKKMVEILDRYGIKCTFNINSGLMGVGRRMSREDCIALFKNSPHEVAVHGSKQPRSFGCWRQLCHKGRNGRQGYARRDV